MLKKIKLDNFTTFIKPTEVDFTATKYKFLEDENVSKNKILKGCLFVGENASGKTMLLKSIKLLLDLLFNDDSSGSFLRYKSLFTNKKSCSIEYTFVINNKEIIYSYEFSTDKILSEKLVYNNEEIINRLGITATLNFNGEKSFKDISDKMLFIRRVYFDTDFYGNKDLIKWFSFLNNSVYIDCYNKFVMNYNKDNLSIHETKDKTIKNKINAFFEEIGYDQTIEIGMNYDDSENIVVFNKKGFDVPITEYFESTGNRTLLEILPKVFHAIEHNSILLLDEFSSGLHNELEECLIKYFFHYAEDSQLFFTSHSTNILNNTILRPDQVYAVGFDSKNGAYLKRFSDEMPRESQNLEKMYLNGVFDGLPGYNKIFKDKQE